MSQIQLSAGRQTFAGLLMIFVAGLFGAGCGAGSSHDTSTGGLSSESSSTSVTSAPVVNRAPNQLTSHFALFRSPAEGLPNHVRTVIHDATFGQNWDLAQRVPHVREPLWAIPGNGFVCLLGPPEAHGIISDSCVPTPHVLEEGLFTATLAGSHAYSRYSKPHQRIVIGVVPDGTRRVRVLTPGHPIASAPLVDGTFVLKDSEMDPPQKLLLEQER